MSIFITILLLGVIVMIHELGHFIAARFFKIPVSEFSIGMGPELASYYTGKTQYTIRIIPIGGYVNIEGMDSEKEVVNGFNTKSPFQRFVVLFAGVFMNFLLAYLIIMGTIFYNQKDVPLESPIVGQVFVGTKVDGILQKNDLILSIDGKDIQKWSDIKKVVNENQEDIAKFRVKRDGKEMELEVPLTKVENEKIVGVIPKFIKEKYGILEGIEAANRSFFKMFKDTFNGLKQLVTGKVAAKEITGPVGIVKVVGEFAKIGNATVLLWLTAILSINIGIFNLLPFPALDGGRIVFVILEMLGIKMDKKKEEKIHFVGMLILFGIIILITTNDISKIF